MSSQKIYYNREKCAERLGGISVKTLDTWRYKGKGPDFHKFGNAIRYSEEDIIKYEESKKVIQDN